VAGESAEPRQAGRNGPAEIRNVSFPVSRRGYDRDAVDAYVTRVATLIEELEATRSPEAAVTHALREIGDRTSAVLQQAGVTAEEITVAARQRAEADTARAKTEADQLVANARKEADEIGARSSAEAEATRARASAEAAERRQRAEEAVAALEEEAEARLRELEADTEAVRSERRRLLEDIRELAARVEQAAHEADGRFPPPEEEDADTAQERALETESAAEADEHRVNSKQARSNRR
jgi:DivIVA domain-containing protein